MLIKGSALLLIIFFGCQKRSYAQKIIPIQFSEYNVSVETPFKAGDTITYKYSSDEYFRFVFFDSKGKCYCERYLNKKLYEKGYYENSLDTLKTYASKADSHGKSSKTFVLEFFQPLKNGKWITYKNGVAESKSYVMGVLATRLVHDQ